MLTNWEPFPGLWLNEDGSWKRSPAKLARASGPGHIDPHAVAVPSIPARALTLVEERARKYRERMDVA